MSDVDDEIQAALRREERELESRLAGEQPLHEQVLQVFRGRARNLVVVAVTITTIMMAAGIWCLVEFLAAQATRAMLLYGAGFAFSMLAVMAMKIWFWMELNKNSVLREVKRLELQVARLREGLAERKA